MVHGADIRVRLKAGLLASPGTLNPKVCSPSYGWTLHSPPQEPSPKQPQVSTFQDWFQMGMTATIWKLGNFRLSFRPCRRLSPSLMRSSTFRHLSSISACSFSLGLTDNSKTGSYIIKVQS